MNEQDRRMEILKAEEVIRQLAAEMARASGAAKSTEEARQKLEDAAKILEEARQALSTSAKGIEGATRNLNGAADRLEKSAEVVGQLPKTLPGLLSSELSRVASRVNWAIVLASASLVAAGLVIYLLLSRLK